jgi:hypothetical protein
MFYSLIHNLIFKEILLQFHKITLKINFTILDLMRLMQYLYWDLDILNNFNELKHFQV